MSSICDDLRAAILQAAIQGKLTKQLESDGDAGDLLAQIKNEKDKLIKEGVIKKNKEPYHNPEEDTPFAIPKNWKWCSPEEIGVVVVGATPSRNNPSFWEAGTIPWLPSGCCQDCEVTNSCSVIKYITNEAYDSCSTKKMPENTVMIALTGATAGKVGLLRFEACANQSVVGITPFRKSMAKYLFYQLMGRRNEILNDCVGSAQPHISKDYITKMVFPIPPEREQERIVQRIEDLLARVADLEQSADALASLKKAFPDDIKASLLQAAMQGKLTEQLPEDGGAEELLNQIKAEKEKLIAEGKIKKQKPLAPIADDEIPFSIPENWRWVRLIDVCEEIGDIDHNMPKASASGGIPFLSAKDINDDFSLNFKHSVKLISFEDYERLGRKMRPQAGDIIFSRIGSLGKTAIVDTEKKFLVSYSCCIMRPLQLDLRYFAYYLICPIIQAHIQIAKTGIGVPDLGMGEIKACLMPLPPLLEQKRIARRLDAFMQNINVVGDLVASE